ncbi:MAG: hypothetical protein ACRDLD_16180 [Thermoleophilaceae bacterium]
MLAIHPNARTTPTVRAEIARLGERAGELARREAREAAAKRRPELAERAQRQAEAAASERAQGGA